MNKPFLDVFSVPRYFFGYLAAITSAVAVLAPFVAKALAKWFRDIRMYMIAHTLLWGILFVCVLALSALLAATFGVLMGALIKDINTLLAIIKAIGILLYAPAFIYIFPGIPTWIGKLFPTYYMIGPIMDITQNDATWSQIAGDVYILIGLIIALIAVVAVIARRESAKEV